MTRDELLLVRDVLERVALNTEEGERNRRKALHYVYRELRLKDLDPRMGDDNVIRLGS